MSTDSNFNELPNNSITDLRDIGGDHFSRDLQEMMFGFGDQWPPCRESVQLIETLVKEYIADLAHRAQEIALKTEYPLDKECFIFLVRADQRKFSRIQRLLNAHHEIQNARKVRKREDNLA